MTARTEKKAATRERLLVVAADLFRERGFEGVSFRDLAAAAQVSTATFVFHFNSKEAIFAAAMGRDAPDLRQFVRDVADSASEFSAEAKGLLGDQWGEWG